MRYLYFILLVLFISCSKENPVESNNSKPTIDQDTLKIHTLMVDVIVSPKGNPLWLKSGSSYIIISEQQFLASTKHLNLNMIDSENSLSTNSIIQPDLLNRLILLEQKFKELENKN